MGRTTKKRDEYLQFQVVMSISPEHRVVLEKLSVLQATIVVQELSLELARLGISWQFSFGTTSSQSPTPNRLENVGLSKGLPFSSLSEAIFISSIDAMDSAATVVRAVLALALQRLSSETRQPILEANRDA